MATSTEPPPHKLFESPNCRAIELNGWTITASTNPIANAMECDALQAQLGFPLPEMTFSNNSLTLDHQPSGWRYKFDLPSALSMVRNGELQDGDGGVKVGYADAWLKSRTGPMSSLPMPKTVPTKPYDWTYTTVYSGHVDAATAPEWRPRDDSNPDHCIPVAELSRQDPIAFYAEIPLFEDELHDNGSSALLVRIRIMPTCLFILSRFTLRVDGVLFRMWDTRIYHSFASSPPIVVRETSGWEAPYERVKRQLPRRDDMTPLTDHTFIGRTLAGFPRDVSQKAGAGTGWRGLGTTVEVATLEPNA